MESLYLTSRTPKIVQVSRDRAYFDRYEYCFNFRMEELASLRELNHQAIDRDLDHRSHWRERNQNFGGSWRSCKGAITQEHRDHCHALCDFFLTQTDYKLVIYSDWGYVYTNDVKTVNLMLQRSYVHPISLKRVQIDLPRDSIFIKSSTHEWRSYFRAGRISDIQKHNLSNFLQNQTDIRIGPGLQRFLESNNKHHYINDNLFIDHDGRGVIVMLELILPRAIRKTLKLVRDK